MTTTQEALKMAIEAMKWLRHQNITNPFPETEAERACKKALEQQEPQYLYIWSTEIGMAITSYKEDIPKQYKYIGKIKLEQDDD